MVDNFIAETGEEPLKRLLPESAAFRDFVNSNAVLVDKTDLIRDLLNSSPTRTFFLSRPRRFGKTLLLDTIQNIAKGDRKPFIGLHIRKGGVRILLGTVSGYSDVIQPFRVKPENFQGKIVDNIRRNRQFAQA
jgi:hypothetical protein